MSNENFKNKSIDELREMKAKGEAELKRLHNKSKYYAHTYYVDNESD